MRGVDGTDVCVSVSVCLCVCVRVYTHTHQAGVECGDILRKVDGTDVLAMKVQVSETE